MLIKLLLLLAIALVAAFFMRPAPGARGRAMRRLGTVAFAFLAALSVIFPEVLTRVANLVGVGRGADLLLYALVIVVLGFMGANYRNRKAFEVTLTQLARRMAIDEARDEIGRRRVAHGYDAVTGAPLTGGPAAVGPGAQAGRATSYTRPLAPPPTTDDESAAR